MQPEVAPAVPDPSLIDALVTALTVTAAPGWTELAAEWSQAGTQHSGRMYRTDSTGTTRALLPDAAVTVFAQLRAVSARPGTGTWLSARMTVTADGEHEFTPNYDERPIWNSPSTWMRGEVTTEPVVPDDERWVIDLRRYPRDRAHIPPWLSLEAVEGEAVAQLRAALDQANIPRAAVDLPGEPPQPRFEGMVQLLRTSPTHFTVQVEDYGLVHRLGDHRTEHAGCTALWQYLTAPMPQPLHISGAEYQARRQGAQRSFADLRARLVRLGRGGLLTNLAPGVLYDRYGGIDGLYFFEAGTPWEQRSLPQTAVSPSAQFVTFAALRPVEVQAEIVDPWFDQPGGGLRFHVEGGRSIRDLVREGVLAVVVVVA